MGNASKPITLRPLKFDEAVSAIVKVKPEEPKPKAKKQAVQKTDG